MQFLKQIMNSSFSLNSVCPQIYSKLACILIYQSSNFQSFTVFCQEPVEVLSMDHVLDLDFDGKLHVLSGGTKVVQHTPPSKSGPGLKGKKF